MKYMWATNDHKYILVIIFDVAYEENIWNLLKYREAPEPMAMLLAVLLSKRVTWVAAPITTGEDIRFFIRAITKNPIEIHKDCKFMTRWCKSLIHQRIIQKHGNVKSINVFFLTL